jgi:two-component system CheB/CheR fusion protein
MVELGETNDDLYNLLSAVDTPLVISSLDLRIRRFTAAAGRLFDLIPADVGRPISHLKSFLDCSDLDGLAAEVIRSEKALEREVRDRDRRAYAMRVIPYRGSDQAVRGAVLELRPSPA